MSDHELRIYEVRERMAEPQDLCRVPVEDAETSAVTIAELKAELAKFHPCDQGICMIDESTHE